MVLILNGNVKDIKKQGHIKRNQGKLSIGANLWANKTKERDKQTQNHNNKTNKRNRQIMVHTFVP